MQEPQIDSPGEIPSETPANTSAEPVSLDKNKAPTTQFVEFSTGEQMNPAAMPTTAEQQQNSQEEPQNPEVPTELLLPATN